MTESSSLEKSLHLKSIPSLPPKFCFGENRTKASDSRKRERNYSPLDWNEFFDEKRLLTIAGDKFNVYLKGKSGPTFLCLHGGGYSGLTWACLAEELSQRIECQIVAPDLRGHGDTFVQKDPDDFSVQKQIEDISSIYQCLIKEREDGPPPTFVIGHSMGGALAVHAACRNLIPNLLALAVIDVVEGSAMEALSGMRNFLRSRPHSFTSVQDAIEWCLKTGTVRNSRAARISMPSQVTPRTSEISSKECLEEVSEEEPAVDSGTVAENCNNQTSPPPCRYEWRIDLMKSEPYWAEWFQGMSELFLSVDCPKVLILANVDRLDKCLTVGQMQGKFQMIVLPKVGHAVHEDSPNKLADVLTTFCVRNKFCQAKGAYTPMYPGC